MYYHLVLTHPYKFLWAYGRSGHIHDAYESQVGKGLMCSSLFVATQERREREAQDIEFAKEMAEDEEEEFQ